MLCSRNADKKIGGADGRDTSCGAAETTLTRFVLLGGRSGETSFSIPDTKIMLSHLLSSVLRHGSVSGALMFGYEEYFAVQSIYPFGARTCDP
jgi:hypothetical protein